MATDQDMLACEKCGKPTVHIVKKPNGLAQFLTGFGLFGIHVFGTTQFNLTPSVNEGVLTAVSILWNLAFIVILILWMVSRIDSETTKCTVCGNAKSQKRFIWYVWPGFLLLSILSQQGIRLLAWLAS